MLAKDDYVVRYALKYRFGDILQFVLRNPGIKLVYGAATCWWNIPAMTKAVYQTEPHNGIQLPADPLGGPLFETDDALKFLRHAETQRTKWGIHGLETFAAAFHGNVTVDGKPTTFQEWPVFDYLVDQKPSSATELRVRRSVIRATTGK